MDNLTTERQYPIGRFSIQEHYSSEELAEMIENIAGCPARYRQLTADLSEADLAKVYREGSWNIRQLVHHVADIQYLHYFRMKKAITEPDYEMVTMINMDAWAVSPDSLTAPVSDSLLLLEGATARYVRLAGSLTEAQLALAYFHPIRKIWFNQKQALAISSWHVRHHLAHIAIALEG